MSSINFKSLWNKSGDIYHDYALNFPQYIKTNEKLVEFADIQGNQIIVDLACGTGLTTKEILRKNPNVNKIFAIDFSKNMINVAKNYINSNKVSFIIGNANNINNLLKEKVDLIVCNSAFWQFDNLEKVLNSASKILKENGKFVFNLNQQFFNFTEIEKNQKLIIEFIFKELKKRKYKTDNKIKSKLKMDYILNIFSNSGFRLEKVLNYNLGIRTLEDFVEFLKIPATATFFEGVNKKDQEDILKNVYENFNYKNIAINNRWIYFKFYKN